MEPVIDHIQITVRDLARVCGVDRDLPDSRWASGGCDEAHLDDHRGTRCGGQLQVVPVAVWTVGDGPAHAYFGQVLDSDGTVLLCLHEWGAHEHPSLMSPDHATPGNGLLLFFRVDDFDAALQRARALVTRFEEEPHANPNTRTREFSLRDPDGYYVTISALVD